MTKYKISLSLDEKNYFWIVVDNGILIRYPTKEDLKRTKLLTYNKTNICPICRKENNITDKSILYPKNTRKFNIGGELIWYCERHSGIYRQKLPNSGHNIIKLMAKCRTGSLGIESTVGKGIISQATVAKTLCIEDLNIKNDSLRCHIDMRNERYGGIDVKAESPDGTNRWDFHTSRKIHCDTYICLGMDRGWKNVDAVLIIPNEGRITSLNSIRVSRHPSRKSIYDKFRTDAEPYRNTYHSLMSYLGDKKVFDIEYIKRWLNGDI